MDIVLGVSMAPATVRMVLVEGENADGVTVDHDGFDIATGGAGGAPDRVLAAILGTRESAREGGYQLSSTGVTWTDQSEAAALRVALVDRKIENVMLISAFLAAAALAQAVGSGIRYARTGLLFVEPDTATLAVVDSIDGSIAEIHRQPLSRDDDRAVAELTAMVAGVDRLASRPDGLFVVGSGVDIALIKPELEKASPVPVSAPEEPELALARGAALASAHAPLFSSSTRALAWAQDPGTGALDPALVNAGYAYVPVGPADYNATSDNAALAYSAAPDYPDSGYLPAPPDRGPAVADDPELFDSRLLDFGAGEEQPGRKPFLLTGSLLIGIFVVGVVALTVALAVSIRPFGNHRPEVRANVVTPAQHAPAPPPKAQVPAPPPQPAPAPAPVVVPAPPEAPAPEAHGPEAPPPPPPPAAPPGIPGMQIPGLPGGPPILGPPKGGWGGDDDWGHGGGHGGGHGHGGGGHGGGIKIPLGIPGLNLDLGG
ncbi:MAG: hypothetical protein ABI307_10765 [Mycobacterium sp.]